MKQSLIRLEYRDHAGSPLPACSVQAAPSHHHSEYFKKSGAGDGDYHCVLHVIQPDFPHTFYNSCLNNSRKAKVISLFISLDCTH